MTGLRWRESSQLVAYVVLADWSGKGCGKKELFCWMIEVQARYFYDEGFVRLSIQRIVNTGEVHGLYIGHKKQR